MSVTRQLLASASCVLNGSGGGQVILGPAIPGVTWYPSGGACLTSSDTSTPVFYVYLNSVGQASYVGGSQTGNNDSCAINQTLYTGMTLIGVWVGGDAGATATFTITGTQDVPA